ncbi:hypothetical protein RI367_004309 [Sorochytrium milnesiophthora]
MLSRSILRVALPCLFLLLLTLCTQPAAADNTLATNYCAAIGQCDTVLGTSANPLRTTYATGDSMSMLVKLLYTNTTVNTTGSYTTYSNYSAMFFPKVDDYTKLTIPNSWNYLISPATLVVAVDLIYAGSRYTLGGKKWYNPAVNGYAPFRTVVITMTNGVPTGMAWEDTTCFYSNCGCIDNICPIACTDPSTATCNIEVHVEWAGTDVNGKYLTSSMYSIYKLQNVI